MKIKPSIKIFLIPAILFAAFFVFGNEARAAEYYVDNTTTSCDTSPHANYDPATDTCGSGGYTVYSTIQGAADVVNPGDTVIVADGVYTNAGVQVFMTWGKSGTPTNRIKFKSENKWGAVLDGQNITSLGLRLVYSNYITLEGFEIKNFQEWAIHLTFSNNLHTKDIYIHDIGRVYCCTYQCRVLDGFAVGGLYGGAIDNSIFDSTLIHDVGRLPCGDNDTHDYGNDHGFYVYGDNVSIINGIYYNMVAGWPIQITGGSFKIINNVFGKPSNPLYANGPPNTYKGKIITGNYKGPINILLENNIFDLEPNDAGVYFWGVWDTTTLAMRNNILSCNGYYYEENHPIASGILENNLNNTNPSFVDALNHNFHLQAGSLAINAGLATNAPFLDFDGITRSSPPEIGAYEYAEATDITSPSAPQGLSVQ